MPKIFIPIIIAAIVAVVIVRELRDTAPPAPAFSDYPAGEARKTAFFDYFAPLVAAENERIRKQRERVLAWRDAGGPGPWQRSAFETLAADYFMADFNPEEKDDWDELLERIDTIPASLPLAQAAKESGWGTSRFATTANNYFGERCFSPGCGVVPQGRPQGATYEFTRFASPAESVRHYLRNLNRHRAYARLRDIRARARDREEPLTGIALTAGLENYSERGHRYLEEIRSLIRFNSLEQYE